jgi:hypothetical protein
VATIEQACGVNLGFLDGFDEQSPVQSVGQPPLAALTVPWWPIDLSKPQGRVASHGRVGLQCGPERLRQRWREELAAAGDRLDRFTKCLLEMPVGVLVAVTRDTYGIWTDLVWIEKPDAKIVRNDLIEFVATGNGTYSYTSVLGADETVPDVSIVRLRITG